MNCEQVMFLIPYERNLTNYLKYCTNANFKLIQLNMHFFSNIYYFNSMSNKHKDLIELKTKKTFDRNRILSKSCKTRLNYKTKMKNFTFVQFILTSITLV